MQYKLYIGAGEQVLSVGVSGHASSASLLGHMLPGITFEDARRLLQRSVAVLLPASFAVHLCHGDRCPRLQWITAEQARLRQEKRVLNMTSEYLLLLTATDWSVTVTRFNYVSDLGHWQKHVLKEVAGARQRSDCSPVSWPA